MALAPHLVPGPKFFSFNFSELPGLSAYSSHLGRLAAFESLEHHATFESLGRLLDRLLVLDAPLELFSGPTISALRGPSPALRVCLDFSFSSSDPDLSSLESMSRQNPRRPI